MKFAIFAIIFALVIVVQAGDVSWYVGGSRNQTCTGHSDTGAITCESGHKDGAQEVDLNPNEEKRSTIAIRGREISDPTLDKRVTCNIDGLGCFTHCFAIGYCNSHCNSDNVCICTCKDETPWWDPIVCSKTSCA